MRHPILFNTFYARLALLFKLHRHSTHNTAFSHFPVVELRAYLCLVWSMYDHQCLSLLKTADGKQFSRSVCLNRVFGLHLLSTSAEEVQLSITVIHHENAYELVTHFAKTKCIIFSRQSVNVDLMQHVD